MRLREVSAALPLIAAMLLVACTGPAEGPAQRYNLQGKVVSVQKEERQVTVAHEAIPGYMTAMTMPFHIREEWPFRILAPGQRIGATLVVQGGRSWLEEITVTQADQDAPSGGTAGVAEPEAGAEVPDFTLTNQDGRRIRVRDYRGSALLITFIYTRCPLPDYCPRMSSHFADIHKALRSDPQLEKRVRLLTVSFDPEFDTPEVLRSYGGAYVGRHYPDDFRVWEFATGTKDEVKAVCAYFGLNYWKETGEIVHSLRTALIDTDGRLVQMYRGNEWQPGDVLERLRPLLQRAPDRLPRRFRPAATQPEIRPSMRAPSRKGASAIRELSRVAFASVENPCEKVLTVRSRIPELVLAALESEWLPEPRSAEVRRCSGRGAAFFASAARLTGMSAAAGAGSPASAGFASDL